jgi:hypothetical protein
LLVLALIASLPGTAAAQFTTFIPPQTRVADSVKAVVAAQQKVQQDSSAQAQLTNMKTWVDSAAGVTPPPVTADSVASALAATNNGDTAAFRNGMRAPETASDLPLLIVIGVAALGLGTLLLGGGDAPRTRA